VRSGGHEVRRMRSEQGSRSVCRMIVAGWCAGMRSDWVALKYEMSGAKSGAEWLVRGLD